MTPLLKVKYQMLMDGLKKRADQGEVIEFKEYNSFIFMYNLSVWLHVPHDQYLTNTHVIMNILDISLDNKS